MGLTQSPRLRHHHNNGKQEQLHSSTPAADRSSSETNNAKEIFYYEKRKFGEPDYSGIPTNPERMIRNDTVMESPTHEYFVDDPTALSQTLARQASKRSYQLRVFFVAKEPIDGLRAASKTPIVAQAGLIRFGRRKESWPVSAKHVFYERNHDGAMREFDPTFCPSSCLHCRTGAACAHFPKVETPLDHVPGQRRDDDWDVLWGSAACPHTSTAFPPVKRSFRVQVGMKIGVCVYFQLPIKAEDLEVSPQVEPRREIRDFIKHSSPQDLERIYGPARVSNIYTGQVTEVRDDIFLHNMNSFGGCSGAVVFLLDQGQPESVHHSNYGKAIGIHCGSSRHGTYACYLNRWHHQPRGFKTVVEKLCAKVGIRREKKRCGLSNNAQDETLIRKDPLARNE